MKTSWIELAGAAILSATLTSCLSYKGAYQKGYLDAMKHESALLHAYAELDSTAYIVIAGNGLLDTDGSDAMSNYLNSCNKVDSISELIDK